VEVQQRPDLLESIVAGGTLDDYTKGSAYAKEMVKNLASSEGNADTFEKGEVPIQINGKVRDRLVVPVGIEPAALEALVLASPRIQTLLAGRTPSRIVQAGGGKLVNLVVTE